LNVTTPVLPGSSPSAGGLSEGLEVVARRCAETRLVIPPQDHEMTFKPATWYPIAVVLCVANVVSVWFAALPAEPLHATGHAALAVAFGVWARHLRQRPSAIELQALVEDLEAQELETSRLRQELSAAQERLDFAERRLTQGAEPRRDGTQT
jgi:hypothetical protein